MLSSRSACAEAARCPCSFHRTSPSAYKHLRNPPHGFGSPTIKRNLKRLYRLWLILCVNWNHICDSQALERSL